MGGACSEGVPSDRVPALAGGCGKLSGMGTFDWHSDVSEIPMLQGFDGLAAFALWGQCGNWTSVNGRAGIVPTGIASEFSDGQRCLIDLLVEAGLWEHVDGGYLMLRGPTDDPDQPLPLWRYGDEDLDGRPFGSGGSPNI